MKSGGREAHFLDAVVLLVYLQNTFTVIVALLLLLHLPNALNFGLLECWPLRSFRHSIPLLCSPA